MNNNTCLLLLIRGDLIWTLGLVCSGSYNPAQAGPLRWESACE